MRPLVCALTGKGPLKEYYEKMFREKNYKHIRIHFIWLEPSDYPTLLGSADLGVCLHKSSSNLDLPMKVVDMFGCRLPVCALNFACISELVKVNENGLLFETGKELAKQLIALLNEDLNDEGSSRSRLAKYRQNLSTFSSWNDEWNKNVKNLLLTI